MGWAEFAPMKNIHLWSSKTDRKLAWLVVLAVLALVVVPSLQACRVVWTYDHLEQRAKKVVTGSELQTWATNLLAANPKGKHLIRSNWGSDFPKQLFGLCPRMGPGVRVYEAGQAPGGNGPPWVRVMWSSGMLGASGFEVGATNFVCFEPKAHAWQPGVYFFRR
jgi:hypothetical protein